MRPIARSVPSRLLFLSLTALLVVGCSEPPPPQTEVIRPVRAMKIADFAGFGGRSFPGTARAIQEVDLAFEVAGTLIERPVNIGDRIEAGQLVAKLDPRNFQARVQAARAELTKNAANLKRGRELIEDDFISRTELDRLQAARDISDAELQLALKALSDSVIEAPFDGVITNLFVENFQTVQPKQPVARLLDNSRIEFVVNIPERLISLVPLASNIRVRFDAFRDVEIPAEITEISQEATAATRTFPVTLAMDQPEGIEILPGMAGVAYGEREAADSEQPRAVDIPVTAVFSPENTNQSFVWVIDESSMTTQRRPVTVDRLSDTGITISEGLEPGEWIAVAGVHTLREGQKVRIQDASEG